LLELRADDLPFLRCDDHLDYLRCHNSGCDNGAGLRGHIRGLDTGAAALLNLIFPYLRALPVALVRDDEELALLFIANDIGADDGVFRRKLHGANSARAPAHLTDVSFFEADGLSARSREDDGVTLHDREDFYQTIALIEPHRDDAGAAHIGEFFGLHSLRYSAFGHEHERGRLARFHTRFCFFGHGDDGGHPLLGRKREDIHDGLTLGRAFSFRNLIHAGLVHLAAVGEEEDVVMRRTLEESDDEVFLFRVEVDDANPAPFLLPIFCRVRALHEATGGKREHRGLIRHEVFVREILDTSLHDARPTQIPVLLFHGEKLLLDDGHNLLRRRENILTLLYESLNLLEFVLNLLSLQASKFLEAHFENGRRLEFGKLELLHEGRVRILDILCGPDELHYLVDVVERLREAEEDVLAVLRFSEVELRPALHNLLAVRDKI